MKNEKDFQKAKSENQKVFNQKIKENKGNYNKKVSDAETEYKFNTENIKKQYQDEIQSSNDKLDNMLTLAKQKLEAALEANEKVYSAKVKACIDGGVAKIHEEWSKRDAEEKRIKCEKENLEKSDNMREHKTAQELRDRKLNKAFEDKQSKILKAETDTLSNKVSDEQVIIEFDKLFEEMIKSNKDAQMKQIKENNEEEKSEKEKFYEQNNKEIKDNYDNAVSDAEKLFKDAENLIEKEYADAVQTSNTEFNDKIEIAQQKLDAAVEANKHKYELRVNNSWFWKSSIREEWSKKDSEEHQLKIERDETARAEKSKDIKKAQNTKQKNYRKLLKINKTKLTRLKHVRAKICYQIMSPISKHWKNLIKHTERRQSLLKILTEKS